MSEQEYKSRLNALKPFVTLLIVVMGSAFLASCGGGSGDSNQTIQSDSATSDDPMKQALGVSGGTVPGTWKGRRPLPNKIATTPRNSYINYSDGLQVAVQQIVLTKSPSSNEAEARAWISSRGWEIIGNLPDIHIYQVRIKNATSTGITEAILEAERSGFFSASLPNIRTGLDSEVGEYYPDPKLDNSDWSWGLDSIKLTAARKAIDSYPSQSPVAVAILDSGFRYDHGDVDFAGIYSGNGTPTPTMSECTYGALFDKYECDSALGSDADHGMHIAGIIGAKSNNSLGVGIAEGRVALYGYSVTNNLEALSSIALAQAKSVRIINISQHARYMRKPSQVYDAAVYEKYLAGITSYGDGLGSLLRMKDPTTRLLIVRSAGNYGDIGADTPELTYARQPASLNGLEGASISSLSMAQTSNKAAIKERLLIVGAYYISSGGTPSPAPGTMLPQDENDIKDVYLLAPGGRFGGGEAQSQCIQGLAYTGARLNATFNPGMCGTSQATPHVTGVAALIASILPNASATEIRDIILDTASNNLGASYLAEPNKGDGFRYLNAEAAVRLAIAKRPKSGAENIFDDIRSYSQFTKLDDSGNALPASSTNWACTLDKATNLVWEIKTRDGSIQDLRGLTSSFGIPALINTLNSKKWCGRTDWRMPSPAEIYTLSSFDGSASSSKMNAYFFDDWAGGVYWVGWPFGGSAYSYPAVRQFYSGNGTFGINTAWFGCCDLMLGRMVSGSDPFTAGRYTYSNDGNLVYDPLLHVTWRRCSSGRSFYGSGSVGICDGPPTATGYQVAVAAAASYGQGWRLPNSKELMGLNFASNVGIGDSVWSSTPFDSSAGTNVVLAGDYWSRQWIPTVAFFERENPLKFTASVMLVKNGKAF